MASQTHAGNDPARTAADRAERRAVANPQWSLGFMLLALHAALAWGIDGGWPQAFLLTHFGAFLLWQPVWGGRSKVEPKQAFLVIGVAVLLVGWYSWWLMALWLAGLVALISGSMPRITERRQRLISMLAVLYLLSLLLMRVVPQLFTGQVIDPVVGLFVAYGLPLLPAAILFVRVPTREQGEAAGVDLFYGVVFFLLVVALVLGSFVIRDVSEGPYLVALAQTLVVIAVALVCLSWLWYPHSGFAGLGYLLSSYLMSLGMPFERWVQRLAALAQEHVEPQRFLTHALEHLLDVPWVRGLTWYAPAGQGELGTRTGHAAEVRSGEFKLTVYTRWAASPEIVLHLKLLAQMVGHFHEAKLREQAQRQNAYTHAIYETGARLTHDVKNLLQSLKSLCAAAASSTPGQAVALQGLMQRQLPQITQRLNSTLDKLRSPLRDGAGEVSAGEWWESLQSRYTGRNIRFNLDGALGELTLVGELFDSVADNLIENALNKGAGEHMIEVRVTFSAEDRGTLTVCDNGAAMPKAVADHLFDGAVSSNTGLGVGLYQAGRLAAQCGYRLALTANAPGIVCFVLAGGGASAGVQAA